jgi:hypothetical protein
MEDFVFKNRLCELRCTGKLCKRYNAKGSRFGKNEDYLGVNDLSTYLIVEVRI